MRATQIAASLAVSLCLTLPLMAQTDVMLDKTVEGIKSRDAAQRQVAVAQLVGLRVAAGRELRRVVEEANAEAESQASKTAALYLIGFLGLPECTDILERESGWEPDVASLARQWRQVVGMIVIGKGPSGNALFEHPADTAIRRVRLSATVRACTGVSASFAGHPALAAAFDNLRSSEYEAWRGAIDSIAEWHTTVVKGAASVLSEGMKDVYPAEVKVAALHVLGEYRPEGDFDFRSAADVEDTTGESGRYAATLGVEGADARYPVMAAIVKCGPRLLFRAAVIHLQAPSLDQATRARVASAIAAADPEAARQAYVTEVDNYGKSFNMVKLARLQSVGNILAP